MQSLAIQPPTDVTIRTLWLGNIDADVTEADIFNTIYICGHVVHINIARTSRCAFVEFASRQAAESAIRQLHGTLSIKGRQIPVKWGKSRCVELESPVFDGEADIPLPPGASRKRPLEVGESPSGITKRLTTSSVYPSTSQTRLGAIGPR